MVDPLEKSSVADPPFADPPIVHVACVNTTDGTTDFIAGGILNRLSNTRTLAVASVYVPRAYVPAGMMRYSCTNVVNGVIGAVLETITE